MDLKENLLTIDDLATMTGLSTRTIRSYLASGQLAGEKVDGAWHFTPEQFGSFITRPMVRQSVQAKANALVYDFLLQEKSPGCCTVLDIPAAGAEDEAALRQKLLELVQAGDGLRFHYRHEKGMARVVLVGPPGDIARLMAALDL